MKRHTLKVRTRSGAVYDAISVTVVNLRDRAGRLSTGLAVVGHEGLPNLVPARDVESVAFSKTAESETCPFCDSNLASHPGHEG